MRRLHRPAARAGPAVPAPAGRSGQPRAAPDAAALLPVSLASLAAAARTAARFAAAYTTWNRRQPPAAWAARLRPLATAQLARQLTQAAATPASARARQSSTGTITSEQARLLAASMIIITVQVRQVTTSPSGTTRAVTALAITLVPRAGRVGRLRHRAGQRRRRRRCPRCRALTRNAAAPPSPPPPAPPCCSCSSSSSPPPAAASSAASPASACQLQPAPSTAGRGIPAGYLAGYVKRAAPTASRGPSWPGIGEVESGHGRSDLPGVHSGTNAYGAAGPMQFGVGGVIGDTWGGAPVHPASQHTGGYGIDGDGDGIVDVYDPGDAIPSAAAFLVAHGAPGNIPAALTAWDHSPATSPRSRGWAATYAATGAAALAAAAAPACQQVNAAPLPAGTAGKILGYAEQQLGKPYLWGATGPDAFDCSGLAMMAYQAAGITIPRTSQAQWAYGKQIPASQAQPGDLVFFAGSDGTMTAPGHVGIVLKPGTMIDAPYTGQVVREEPISDTPDLVGYTQPPA